MKFKELHLLKNRNKIKDRKEYATSLFDGLINIERC